jgi:hypothetical protein
MRNALLRFRFGRAKARQREIAKTLADFEKWPEQQPGKPQASRPEREN